MVTPERLLQVLLIGGSTGTMLEALQVIGDTNEGHIDGDVSSYFTNDLFP